MDNSPIYCLHNIIGIMITYIKDFLNLNFFYIKSNIDKNIVLLYNQFRLKSVGIRMNKIVALTGSTGNMGVETLRQLMEIEEIEVIKVLIREESRKKAKKLKNKYRDRIEIIIGNIQNKSDCKKLIKNTDYVFNLAAVIPPKSDKFPELNYHVNYLGTKNIADSILEEEDKPKLIHISTVALYGNRNEKNPWARVGDPLIINNYDLYSYYKLKGERYILESELENRVIIRQTAMLHNRMLTDNMSDGLMFHTCYNSPLEWITARDSGFLMKRIIEEDIKNKLDDYFWKGVFNLGSKAENRIIGFDIFNEGFKLIGGSAKKYMQPNWNALRNFHGVWYYDGDKLEKLFKYQRESINHYWKEIAKRHWYYSLAKLLPSKLIKLFAIERLLLDSNSPRYWRKNKEDGKIISAFKSEEDLKKLPKKWKDFNLLTENKDREGNYINYEELKNINKAKLLNHGYDEDKKELDIEDLKKAAEFRGGKLLSDNIRGGGKLLWECSEGHKFEAKPFTIIKAGHWCEECLKNHTWNYDILSKKSPFFAQVYYDSHDKDENIIYYFDKDFKAFYKKVENF